MPRNQQIGKEYYRVHDRIRALLLDVEETTREPRIILSRGHRDFLRRLLENEVPEIYQGLVEIRSIAREAGYRSKVAVTALKPGVDPVGACVGIRGVRIQAIVRELSDEKIDVIEWNPNTEEFIAKALSPARVLSVFLNKETDGMPTATVVVPEDQLSLAIGRNGQNARLAAKLSGWRIDIKGLFEATSETLFKIQDDPKYTHYQDLEAATLPRIESIMGKKAEGRPISPEEYRELHNFNSRIESGLIKEKQQVSKQLKARIQATKKAVPNDAYDLPIMTLGLSTKVENLLTEAGYSNVGELAYRLLLSPNSINKIGGIGPSSIKQIESALEVMIGYEPLPEELAITEELELEDDSPSADADEKAKGDETDEEETETSPDDKADADETEETKAEAEKSDVEKAEETETDVDDKAETETAEADAEEIDAEEEADPDVEADGTETEEEVAEEDPVVGIDEGDPDTADEIDAESNDAETETQDEE